MQQGSYGAWEVENLRSRSLGQFTHARGNWLLFEDSQGKQRGQIAWGKLDHRGGELHIQIYKTRCSVVIMVQLLCMSILVVWQNHKVKMWSFFFSQSISLVCVLMWTVLCYHHQVWLLHWTCLLLLFHQQEELHVLMPWIVLLKVDAIMFG